MASSTRKNPDLSRLIRYVAARVARERPDLLPLVSQLANKTAPCRHGIDYCSVLWYGTPYVFTASQSAVVKVLWEHWEQGTPNVRQETLQETCGIDGDLRHVFRQHPAFGTMIVSPSKGIFCLQDPRP